MTEEIKAGQIIEYDKDNTPHFIIDGVDVSGCRFLDEYEHCGICKELCEGHCLIMQDIECKTYEDCHYRQLKRLEAENAKLKEELNHYKEMEAKGLEEFKDVGGCWGCGLQLQLNQDIEDLKKCDLENVKLKQALKEIKSIIDNDFINRYMELSFNEYDDILEQIEKICEVLKDE